MNIASYFAQTYQQARSNFRQAAQHIGATIESKKHPDQGPDGGELSVDMAWIGPRNAEKVLVLISGTHGVEGFCGSGAQVAWLHSEAAGRRPAPLAVMLVHAINPYGFAWVRRVDEQNIDLNRNWIDFNKSTPANSAYAEIHNTLCPAEWTEAVQQNTTRGLSEYISLKGMPALQQAVSAGQYDHPLGLFYGGKEPSWSRGVQTEMFANYLAQAGQVGIIDFHTGLGTFGFGEQIVSAPAGSPAEQRARNWFGAATACLAAGESSSAQISGDGLSAARYQLAAAEVTAMALEFGTRPVFDILQALRADAWLHAYGDPVSPDGQAIKKQIRDAFYIDSDDWKGMVVGQAMLAYRQAIAGLGFK